MIRCIASKASYKNGKPLWVFSKDGHLFLSADAVNQATISKARVRL
jgi:hypothetical protein